MTQGDMPAGRGSDAGTQSDASSTKQSSVEQAADMASRMARSDLSTASAGQDSGAATHERQPNIPTDAGRQGDAKPTHQNAIEQGADATSRAARSDLKDSSTKQATDGSTSMRQPNTSHDAGRQGDTSLTDQRVMGPSADIASRVGRSDLSSLSIPQTADKGGNQLNPDQWSTIVEEREPLVRSGTLAEPTPEEINARASLTGTDAISRSAADDKGLTGQTEAPMIEKGTYAYPLGAQGRVGEGPEGHHKRPLGNWESDNAVDIVVPEKTPVYAVADGQIGKQFGALKSENPKLLGLRLHLRTNNNEFYYAHLSQFAPGIKPDDTVKKGDLLGYSGIAGGVPHLHIGVRYGNPIDLLNLKRK